MGFGALSANLSANLEASRVQPRCGSTSVLGPEQVQQREKHDRAEDGNEEAVQVETGNSDAAEEIEQESSEQRTHDTDDNVSDDALTMLVHNLAA
jgi:hypothetical protein